MAKKPTPKKKPYCLTLQIGDTTYKAEGDSVLAALMALKKPDKIMNKGLVTLTYEGYVGRQQYFPARLKRLFYNPSFQAIQAKQLLVTLKPQ